MATVEYKKPCDLCGQAVEIEGFTLVTTEGRQLFCCAGCVSIYRLLHGDKVLATPINISKTDNKEDS
jgi:hypothetical protein